jgi:hypothetical protein
MSLKQSNLKYSSKTVHMMLYLRANSESPNLTSATYFNSYNYTGKITEPFPILDKNLNNVAK